MDQIEEKGIAAIKLHIEEYLKRDNILRKCPCAELITYLEKTKTDDTLLLKYLQGRKGDPAVAWDSLKLYAESRFMHYPEVFPKNGIPDKVRDLVKNHVVGVLKHTDKFGRRIAFLDKSKWDVNVYTLEDVTTACVIAAETFWKEPMVLEKGMIILVETSKQIRLDIVNLFTLQNLLKLRNIFMHGFPISIQGFFDIHIPPPLYFFVKMATRVFPKKIRSRVFLYSANQTPTKLFEIAPAEILPTWAGGNLPVEEAAEDVSFFESYFEQLDLPKQ